MKKRTISSEKPLWFNEINFSQMKGRFLLITANKYEYVKERNVIMINTSSRVEDNNDVDSKYVSSGVVVLCSYILDNQEKLYRMEMGPKTS